MSKEKRQRKKYERYVCTQFAQTVLLKNVCAWLKKKKIFGCRAERKRINFSYIIFIVYRYSKSLTSKGKPRKIQCRSAKNSHRRERNIMFKVKHCTVVEHYYNRF